MSTVVLPAPFVEDCRRFLQTLAARHTGDDGLAGPPPSDLLRGELAAELGRRAPRLLSLHIPKTAGLTFSRVLAGIYGEAFFRSYWELTDCRGETVPALPPHARCLHGHLRLDDALALFPGASLVTWVRGPVQRVGSFYHYWQRTPDWRHPLCRRLHDEKLSLLAFAAQPEARNEMTRFFGCCRPVDFTFIGIFEDLPASMERFFRRFGLPPQTLSHGHKNPERQAGDYAISPAEREEIATLNADDCALYQECVARNRGESPPAGSLAGAHTTTSEPDQVPLDRAFVRHLHADLAEAEPRLAAGVATGADPLLPRWCHDLRGNVETLLLQQTTQLASMHVPLAEAPGFRQLLASVFGERFFQQYGRIVDCRGQSVAAVPADIGCLHGHVSADQLRALLPAARLVTWVRDPVERVAAHYRYWRENPDPANPLCRTLHEENWTLLDFARQDAARNETARFFGTLRPDDFAFIGLLDSFADSVDLLRRVLHATAIPLFAEYRNTPVAAEPLVLTEHEREEIERLNAADCELVADCRRWFQAHRLAPTT